jgi:hypothetical protein
MHDGAHIPAQGTLSDVLDVLENIDGSGTLTEEKRIHEEPFIG